MSEREHWSPGETAWFEYHCYEGHDSGDAKAWYHSHQRVTVIKEGDHDGHWGTFKERMDAGTPKCYRVRFADGLEWDVFEDELVTSVADFSRPNPPSPPTDRR